MRDSTPELFDAPPAESSAHFAEVVFDRPLDQVYTYSVPAGMVGVCPGVRVSVPFGRGDKLTPGYVVNVHAVPPSREVKPIRSLLDARPLVTPSLLKLTRWSADYYLCGWGQALQAVLPAGVREKAGTRRVTFVRAVARERLTDTPPLTPKQAVVLEVARRLGDWVELAHLLRAAKTTPTIVAALTQKKLLEREERRVERGESPSREQSDEPLIRLNAAQQAAWSHIESAVTGGGFHPILLHGVTGSGKTELYLKAIDVVIAKGQQAIVLVPEISLTPQTIGRFLGRAKSVAVLHSHQSDADRAKQWRAVASGQIPVVVGVRSAVFAPCPNLGLIIVDEEHESSFKQDSTPRYQGRDVAVMRARLEVVPILLGSATPALESWHNAQRGVYQLLSLPDRVLDRPLPPVRLVDLRRERSAGAISIPLERAMKTALQAGGQVMLLLNRRGFHTAVHCPACGYVVPCDYCDISMTFHRQRQALVCHYCGFEKPPITTCPICNRDAVRYQGLGTERLQQEIHEKFPEYPAGRMDSDTMAKPGSHERILESFRAGDVRILLGTQMIAKGLDFPNVTLVGVVNADVGLHIPDFRAGERAFQLLAQVAGRAGRGPRGGQVMIQTFAPEHPALQFAAGHDYLAFASQELVQRQAHRYPPYERLARLIIRSEQVLKADEFANKLAGAFRSTPVAGVRVLGPAECPVHKLNGFYRFHFQVQSESSTGLHQALRTALASVRAPSGVEFQVDVDAYSMI